MTKQKAAVIKFVTKVVVEKSKNIFLLRKNLVNARGGFAALTFFTRQTNSIIDYFIQIYSATIKDFRSLRFPLKIHVESNQSNCVHCPSMTCIFFPKANVFTSKECSHKLVKTIARKSN